MPWEQINQSAMLRAWALAEVTSPSSPMEQIPQLDPVREKLRAGEPGTLTNADWQLLERIIRVARQPMLDPLLSLNPTWYRGELPVEQLAEARTINYQPFVQKAPSRRLYDYCMAESQPGEAAEFRREAMTAPPILVGPTPQGPWCLAEGYRRCCRAVRDHQGGRFDGLPLPVIVGIHAEITRWPWWQQSAALGPGFRVTEGGTARNPLDR